MRLAVEVELLTKTYGPIRAVDGVSLNIAQGEIFGMVGPNGAGKTTAIECVEGLRRPDGGKVRVLGLDPISDRLALAERIGIQLQQSGLPARMNVGEAIELFGAFYARCANGDSLLDRLGLSDKKGCPIARLSGGQKQRLFIALALVNQPELVFLDELTTGLDPQARRSMWDLVCEMRDEGRTVFLTTHFMEEAERLCDRVAIMERGKIVALDAPEALIRSLGAANKLIFTLLNGRPRFPLENLPGVERVEISGNRVVVFGKGDRFASTVMGALEDGGVPFRDLRTEQPTLEDVFLKLTGREIRE